MPMLMPFRLVAVMLTCAAAMFCAVSHAEPEPPSGEVAWRLLDYLAVDYPSAVVDGAVVDPAEYAEMQEFSVSVRTLLTELPPTPGQTDLIVQADGLIEAIDRKALATEVAGRAHQLATDLLAAYPVPLAPTRPPDLALGASLYAENCAACHGATGLGDGPGSQGLDPAPIAFADMARARQRSLFGLYQVIGQGLDGTSMGSYAHLSSDDRWALAFYVGGFAFDTTAAEQGERLWSDRQDVRSMIPRLEDLVQTTPDALTARIGEEDATRLVAYLRRHPEAVIQSRMTLSIAREKLAQSLARYEAGDLNGARDLALAAYLDGVEPVEPILATRDRALLARIEEAMGGLRASIAAREPVSEVRAQADRIGLLFDAAERILTPQQGSRVSSFAGAFMILLREGLEALLIVVAMIAFLRKADRPDVLPYVHGGWISALAAGVLTWAAATSLITVSGASREVTEGIGSLLAAIVLISVGIWMHGKGQSQAWQAYIHEKLSSALSKRSAWFLFSLAFVVVYREVFETILFYVALWSQGAHMAILTGAAAAILTLSLIGWALLNYSKRLPLSQFFSYSAILIAGLAVVLAGKGVAALQEAGLLNIHPVSGVPRIELLGLYGSWEGLIAQTLTLAVIVIGFLMNSRRAVSRHGGA